LPPGVTLLSNAAQSAPPGPAYFPDPTQSGKLDVVLVGAPSNFAGNPNPGIPDPTPCGNGNLDAGEVCDWAINVCCNALCTGFNANFTCYQGAFPTDSHGQCFTKVCAASGTEFTCQQINVPAAKIQGKLVNGKKCGTGKIKKARRNVLEVRGQKNKQKGVNQGVDLQKYKNSVFCDGNGKCLSAFTKNKATNTLIPAINVDPNPPRA
jgi:hypothetical protein